MILQVLIFEPNMLISLCAVCISDNNGGKIALLIIILALIALGFGNWAFKKYFSNKKEVSQEK